MVKPTDVINAKMRKRILSHLRERFGIDWDGDVVLLLDPSQRLYGAARDIFGVVDKIPRIDTLGNYWGEWRDDEFRFSIEGAQLFGAKAAKNVLILSREEAVAFMQAKKVAGESQPWVQDGFVIVRCGEDFIGCGRLAHGELVPFIAKNRRLGEDIPD